VLASTTQQACQRAAYYILQGQYDAALKQLDGARSGGSSSADNENLRGLALMLRGDAKGALQAFDRAADLPEARFNRAVALLKLGQNEKAAAEFTKIGLDDSSPLRISATYHAALALDRLGRAAEAEKALERALALDPKFDAALLYVGVLRERRRDPHGAARAYLDFLRRNPESIAAMVRLGAAASRAGRFDVAQTYLRKVIEKAPHSPEAIEARKLLVMWE
jgi:tetratricopeptide (TPR) repeat protein